MSEIADLLERFRRGAELLAVATTGAAGPELDFKPEGKWSVRQIVCHLADSESVAVMRFRQVLAEENASISAWDQNLWTANLGYEKRKISQALEVFRVMRSWNFELLKDVPEEAFARAGTHTERGRITLADLLRIYAEHVEGHVKQIQGVRAAYREHRAKQTVHS